MHGELTRLLSLTLPPSLWAPHSPSPFAASHPSHTAHTLRTHFLPHCPALFCLCLIHICVDIDNTKHLIWISPSSGKSRNSLPALRGSWEDEVTSANRQQVKMREMWRPELWSTRCNHISTIASLILPGCLSALITDGVISPRSDSFNGFFFSSPAGRGQRSEVTRGPRTSIPVLVRLFCCCCCCY